MTPRLVEVRKNVLKKNDELARRLRERFAEAGVYVVSLVSSPGAGKTALLERMLRDLGARARVAALVGDLATENDAARLARSGAPVRQIVTGTVCHLEAQMVAAALEGWQPDHLNYLFIENVGNLVCPTSYDLGEAHKIVLLSVTEGEEKPLKYPGIFFKADLMALTKIDLLPYVPFQPEVAEANARSVHPDIAIIRTSSTLKTGLDRWLEWIDQRAGVIPAR